MTKVYAQGEDSENVLTGSGPVVKQPSGGPGQPPRIIGRYALFNEIASGGMGVVHLGRLVGSGGFERVVAIKRAHPSMARDSEFVAMFREEIRLLSRIRHQNVVAALDVVEDEGELLLVMDYVHGQPLSALARQARDFQRQVPVDICAAVACGVLNGLHAAHTATSAAGAPLGIVHRDVSPQNVLVGCDGVARVLDFGVAKAKNTRSLTRIGQVKGKLGYIAPEHILGKAIDARADVYGLSVVLWEMLASTRLFGGKKDSDTVQDVLNGVVPRLSAATSQRVPRALEEIVRRGLSVDPNARFASAREMSLALQNSVELASAQEVGDWVTETAHVTLVERARQLAWAENCPIRSVASPPPSSAPEIEVADYPDPEFEASDLTVRDANFGSEFLAAELRASSGDLEDVDDAKEELVTQFLLRPAEPLPESKARITRKIAPALPAPGAAESMPESPRRPAPPPAPVAVAAVETQPGKRVRGRGDVFVRTVLYAAGFIALLTIANSFSKGALFARVSRVRSSGQASDAALALTNPKAALAGSEALAPLPSPTLPVTSAVVPLASLPLESAPPRAQTSPRPRAPTRPPVRFAPAPAARKPSAPRPVKLTRPSARMVDGF